MKRLSAFVVTLVALLLLALPALAVNLHNGMIVVHNTTSREIEIKVTHLWTPHHAMESARVAPGATFIANVCCFAAGSNYRVQVWTIRTDRPMADYPFQLRLCNRDGIPYGYGEINVSRDYAVEQVNRDGCYEGPR
ncbi:MAG: hypothetical protein KGN02_14390 [bacterium]|nr:hypothetical protein [bacterium]